jgi:hypothetical protein
MLGVKDSWNDWEFIKIWKTFLIQPISAFFPGPPISLPPGKLYVTKPILSIDCSGLGIQLLTPLLL